MFSVGDRVIIIQANMAPNLVGRECTIIGYHSEWKDWPYEVDIPDEKTGMNWRGPEVCFRKVGDDYDGNAKVSWDDIPWWRPAAPPARSPFLDIQLNAPLQQHKVEVCIDKLKLAFDAWKR